MGKLAEKLESGQKVITAEITPPKGAGIKKLLKQAELLGPHIDALNVTDCQRALVRMSSLAACKVLLDHGHEPVFQLTCRDRNTIALQADLMGAAALKIPNLLCLTGDPVRVGDSPESKPVFEIESVALLQIVQKLQGGQDNNGHKMNAPTKFLVGSVVNPTLTKAASQLARMEKKCAQGARFFQTQANYDPEDMRAFLLESRRYSAKVIAGILILHSLPIAEYIHANIPGIQVPETVIEKFRETSNPEETGIEIAVETMLRVDDACDGFHLMTIRAEELIPKVLERYYARRKTA